MSGGQGGLALLIVAGGRQQAIRQQLLRPLVRDSAQRFPLLREAQFLGQRAPLESQMAEFLAHRVQVGCPPLLRLAHPLFKPFNGSPQIGGFLEMNLASLFAVSVVVEDCQHLARLHMVPFAHVERFHSSTLCSDHFGDAALGFEIAADADLAGVVQAKHRSHAQQADDH